MEIVRLRNLSGSYIRGVTQPRLQNKLHVFALASFNFR